jgi:arsenate reductase
MAEGFLKSFENNLEVFSAGTKSEENVNPSAIEVMKEEGIDLSKNKPKPVDIFLDKEFDYVITVCGGAKEICPAFTGNVKHRLHIGFDDPADATGTKDQILSEFRRIRDEIKLDFYKFYKTNILQNK